MSKGMRKLRVPSDTEEARIQAGIAAGPGQPRMDRGRFPAGKAVRQDVPRPGEKPTGTRAAKEADENRCLATPDAGGGGALQGRRTRRAALTKRWRRPQDCKLWARSSRICCC